MGTVPSLPPPPSHFHFFLCDLILPVVEKQWCQVRKLLTLSWAQSRNLNLIWNNLSATIELGTNLIQPSLLEKLTNSLTSSGANTYPGGSRGHPGYPEWWSERPHQFGAFYFFIVLVPISEQHLAAWQPMPHSLDQHQGLLDTFHGVFLQLFHILTGHWKEAGVTGTETRTINASDSFLLGHY